MHIHWFSRPLARQLNNRCFDCFEVARPSHLSTVSGLGSRRYNPVATSVYYTLASDTFASTVAARANLVQACSNFYSYATGVAMTRPLTSLMCAPARAYPRSVTRVLLQSSLRWRRPVAPRWLIAKGELFASDAPATFVAPPKRGHFQSPTRLPGENRTCFEISSCSLLKCFEISPCSLFRTFARPRCLLPDCACASFVPSYSPAGRGCHPVLSFINLV